MRELGTLKALGWTQRLVVRQVVGESLAQGIARRPRSASCSASSARAAIGAFGPTLTATSTTGGGAGAFGLGALTARTVTDTGLARPRRSRRRCSLLGFLLALVGGLIAGAAGAFRAARLRPADALRTVE